MTHPRRVLRLVCSLALVATVTPYSIAQSVPQAIVATTAPFTAAYVYVQIQGPQGAVYGFRASSTGHLSAIPGSPFRLAGEIIGATPTKFFTVGKDLIHSYGIASDGAIESQLSKIAFFDYSGSECTPSQYSFVKGAVLDHSGKYIYVELLCQGNWSAEYQTYLIHNDGAFSYDGETDSRLCTTCQAGNPPSILGNESFAYADELGAPLLGFRRRSAGTLELMQFTERDPFIGNYYSVYGPDASPAGNFLVAQIYPADSNPPLLASYIVDSGGNISSTNTLAGMPTSMIDGEPRTTFSPSGDLFMVYSNVGGDGIEIYKVNGAAPLIFYKTLLKSAPIDDVKWDRANHLYAISDAANKLYVFTVTATSVTEDSAISIGSPFKMVEVSR